MRTHSLVSVRAFGVASVAIAMAVGCSLAFPASSLQCDADADCAKRGFASAACVEHACVVADAGTPDATTDAGSGDAADGAFPPGWECLADTAFPTPTGDPTTLAQPYENVIGSVPIEGIYVRPCAPLDPTCAMPLADAALTDDSGTATFTLPNGYEGYLETSWDAGIDSLIYVNPPLFSSAPQYTIDMVTKALFDQLIVLTAKTRDGGPMMVDPTAGHVFVFVQGCSFHDVSSGGVAGVTISFDRMGPNTAYAYLLGGVPSSSDRTDSSGNYVLVNMPPGPVTATATIADTGQRIGVASGLVRQGAITYLHLVPSP